MAATKEAGNWTNLPDHILDLIMDRLVHSLPDYKRFGTICVSWRSAYNAHNPRLLPLLMVPPSFSTFTENDYQSVDKKKKKKKKNKKDIRRFYNILNGKLDDTVKAVKMPHYRQCRGSSHGWLITVDDVEFPVRLFNPFLSPSSSSSSLSSSSLGNSKEGLSILLPSLDSLPVKNSLLCSFGYNILHKAVLSANPISNPTDYKVMIIFGGSDTKLAFLKPGDKDWTLVTLPEIKNFGEMGFFEDVILCCQGKFLAIDCRGTVVVCDNTPQGMAARVLQVQPPERDGLVKYYLVESSGGNLLQVHRRRRLGIRRTVDGKYQGRLMYTTLGFKVYKLLLKHHQFATNVMGITAEEDYEWVEIKCFGGDTFFLGDNASFSIRASHYPGCKPNCIYYTDDYSGLYKDEPEDGPQDMGVFNLEDGSFERYYSTDFNDPSKTGPLAIWPVPIWIQQSLPKKKKHLK